MNLNAYIENNDENALKLVRRKKTNKIILISDYEGKDFVNKARKILGFKIIVLFFTRNKNFPNWINNFENALYSKDDNSYKRYIINFDYSGLKKLKEEAENTYHIKLNFTEDYLKNSNFIESGDYKAVYKDKLVADEVNDNMQKKKG